MPKRLRPPCTISSAPSLPSFPIGIGMTDLRALMHAEIFESAENGTLKVKPPPIPISCAEPLRNFSPRFRGFLSAPEIGNINFLLALHRPWNLFLKALHSPEGPESLERIALLPLLRASALPPSLLLPSFILLSSKRASASEMVASNFVTKGAERNARGRRVHRPLPPPLSSSSTTTFSSSASSMSA